MEIAERIPYVPARTRRWRGFSVKKSRSAMTHAESAIRESDPTRDPRTGHLITAKALAENALRLQSSG
jgi:hypothetical protein